MCPIVSSPRLEKETNGPFYNRIVFRSLSIREALLQCGRSTPTGAVDGLLADSELFADLGVRKPRGVGPKDLLPTRVEACEGGIEVNRQIYIRRLRGKLGLGNRGVGLSFAWKRKDREPACS